MENNVNKQSGNGTVYTEKDLDDYIERLKQQKIGNDLTILKEAVRRRPEAVLNIFSSYDITDDRGIIYTTPLAKVDSRFINTVLDTLEKGCQMSQFLNCFRNDTTGRAIDSLSSKDWSPVAKDYVTIKNKNVEDVLEAHPEVLWFTTIFDKEHEGIIDKSYKDGTNKEYMHKAISRLVNKGVDERKVNGYMISDPLEYVYMAPDFPRDVFCKDKKFIEELVLGKDGKNSEEKQDYTIRALYDLVTSRGRNVVDHFLDNRDQWLKERKQHDENVANFYLNILDLHKGRDFMKRLTCQKRFQDITENYPKVVAWLAIKEYIDLKDGEQDAEFANSDVMQMLKKRPPELLRKVVDEIGNIENANVKELSAAVKVLDIMEKMVHEKEYDIAEQKI